MSALTLRCCAPEGSCVLQFSKILKNNANVDDEYASFVSNLVEQQNACIFFEARSASEEC